MPGVIDSHRHMWQTVVRGLGADRTLSRYFEWFTRHRDAFRPEDVHAGNLLSALEAFEAGVTTTVEWSNGLQTVDHADAAVDALEQAHGRFRARVRQHVQTGDRLGDHATVPRLRRPAHPVK